jgi:hypothetical protein
MRIIGGAFRKVKYEIRRRKSEGGQKEKGVWGKGIPAPPERNFLEIDVRIFFEKSSDFIQER